MILTSKIPKTNKFLVLAFCLAFCWPNSAWAQSLELSVTPTLFEMSASPSQVWKSQVKVINSNPYPITVYAQVMNFAPQGESGQGKFVPVFETFTEGTTLAEWIDIDSQPVTIAPEQSLPIPFVVMVPEDASPGGHFAAIMIGTKPPEADKKLKVSTSQIVTSLFFVRVGGDVIEDGTIREFTTEKKFLQTPEVNFSVRFENKGNVHVQPQGSIEITNMWGKERGVIPINSQTHFGNVLPKSIRNFQFTWKGEKSFTDIGRYKAVVTLGYGLEGKKFESRTTYFYVIPVKPLLTVLVSLVFIFWFVSWAIKAYVRRMLSLSGVDVNSSYDQSRKRSLVREGDVLISKRNRVEAPLVSGWVDLRSRLSRTKRFFDTAKTLGQFVLQYKIFFISVIGFVMIFTALYYFIAEVGQDRKNYEVTIDNAGEDVTISSEDIIYEREHKPEPTLVSNELVIGTSTPEIDFTIEIINAGNVPGAAADLKAKLENQGYVVNSIGSDFEESRARTVIIYDLGLEQSALTLSKEIKNALLSANPETISESKLMKVYIGNDYQFE